MQPSLSSVLLRWYRRSGRDLPWRRTTDAYAIVVSEIMLQQTQVHRVIPFFDTWLKTFPTWKDLASASSADVIKTWSGLGYNRRALALQQIAKTVVERGEPSTETDWLAIKGIGPYTAAAITAFSLRKKAIPIDTNIRRVVGRVSLGHPFPSPKDDASIRTAYEKTFLSSRKHFDIPQALFDLANTHCKKMPICVTCPLREHCASADAFLSGKVIIPKASIVKAKEKKHRNKPFPDRIYRGRILKLMSSHGSFPTKRLGPVIDPSFSPQHDRVWLSRMIDRLCADGLLRRKNNSLTLPDGKNALQ